MRQLSIAAAVSVVLPFLTVVSPGVLDASAEPVPISTDETQVRLEAPETTPGDGDQVSASDLTLAKTQAAQAEIAPATMNDAVVLEMSAEKKTPADLTVMGISWQADSAENVVVQYRARTSAGWGQWQGVDSETDAGVEGTAGEPESAARAGTDPIVVTGASHVQMRLLGPEGEKPADTKMSLIDPNESAADARVGDVAPGSAAAAAAKPWINSRRAWGADESIRKGSPSYGRVDGAVVHHTAGTNNYTQAQVPAIMRGIYAFHVKDRGWSDIGYNFLVDKWGRIWEGRAGGTDRAVIGAHASGTNSNSMGISVMGDYTRTSVSNAAIDAVTRTIAWKAGVHGFDPQGRMTQFGRSYPAIVGHRDVGSTTCPGGSIYSKLSGIRANAAALNRGGSTRPSAGAPPSPAAPAARGGSTRGVSPDHVFMRGTSNVLMASSFTGSDVSFARRVHGGNFSRYTSVIGAGDLNRDGRGDVLGVANNGRDLFLFKGKDDGTLNDGVSAGKGWANMRSLTAGADFSGDGVADLMAIDNRGALWLYKGNGNSGFQRKTRIGTGWGAFKQVMSVGDWNGDGRADVIGVRNDGKAFLYRGNGRGGFVSGATQLSGNYSSLRQITPMVGRKAFVGVDAGGNGYLYSRSGATGVTTKKVTPNFRGLTVFGG